MEVANKCYFLYFKLTIQIFYLIIFYHLFVFPTKSRWRLIFHLSPLFQILIDQLLEMQGEVKKSAEFFRKEHLQQLVLFEWRKKVKLRCNNH